MGGGGGPLKSSACSLWIPQKKNIIVSNFQDLENTRQYYNTTDNHEKNKEK